MYEGWPAQDVFGFYRGLRWVQIALALLTAFGLFAALGGIATGDLRRETAGRVGVGTAGGRGLAGRTPPKRHELPLRLSASTG
jgi:hypothetical protein